MSNFIQVTPFMHVKDIGKALAFFNDILGFKTLFRQENYAYLHRETVGFRILEECGPTGSAGQSTVCLLHRRARRRPALCGTEAEA